MNLRQTQARIQLAAIASPPADAPNTTGEVTIGRTLSLISLAGANVAYACRAILADGDKLELDITDGDTSASTLTEFPEMNAIIKLLDLDVNFLAVGGTTDFDVSGFYVAANTGLGTVPLEYTTDPSDVTALRCKWLVGGNSRWEFITGATGLATKYFQGPDEGSIVTIPPNRPDEVETWTPVGGNTGTPVVSGLKNAPAIHNNGDKDIFGREIPTLQKVQGMLIEVISGALTIEVNGEEMKTATAGETRLFAAPNGIPSLLETLEAIASENDTEIKITIIGQS